MPDPRVESLARRRNRCNHDAMSAPGSSGNTWKVCSICKKELAFESQYYVCSVSTCQRKRTGLYFCSLPCFEAHLPMMRHRDAWAEQTKAPTRAQAEAEAAADEAEKQESSRAENTDKRRIIMPAAVAATQVDNDDVLVVVSKLKKFIREQSGMNTSDSVTALLSRHLRELSIKALRVAAADERKTVMDRDFEAVLKKFDA
jgi:histone H3/H4